MTVLSGLETLATGGFTLIKNRRIGLVTNQSAILRDGTSAIEALRRDGSVKLMALFGPEHGVRGDVPAGKWVNSYKDKATGLPVYSLYGPTKIPTAAMLKGLEALVFDLQDIGSRSYTYLSTLGCILEGAARHGLPVIVLDRPNPCGLTRIEGGPIRPGYSSFVGKYPVGYLHGLTLGEAAKMIVGSGWLPGRQKCDLTVAPCQGLTRAFTPWETMSLPWKPSSPNIPKAVTALYYAATGVVGELTCLSIGVGTDIPFELAGAPGLDAKAFTQFLQGQGLSGFTFRPAKWIPSHGVFAKEECHGVRLVCTDPAKAKLTPPSWAILKALKALGVTNLFADSEARKMFDLDCGTDAVRKAFLKGASTAQIQAVFDEGKQNFEKAREPYLLYH